MNVAPVFDKSLVAQNTYMYDFEFWSKVVKTYENKEYKKTIIELLNYINPELAAKTGNSDQTRFVIPHGSILVYLDIYEDRLSVRVLFLKMPKENRVALMRQLTELNFYSLNLVQAVLNDKDEVEFVFEAPLDTCDPYKLYDVFEDICMVADSNDDVFIEKFGAEHIDDPKIKRFSDEMKDKAWEKFQAYLKEAQDYTEYFESRNMYSFCWDVFYTAFTKIDYYIRPQGFLRHELEKAVNELNAKMSLNERISKAKTNALKLQGFSREKFEESLYTIEVFTSEKPKARLNGIKEFLEKNFKTSEQEISKGDGIGATFTLMVGLLDLIYRRDISSAFMDKFVSALADAAQKPWGEAAHTLWSAVDSVMKMENENAMLEKKSFGKKLWNSLSELMGGN